MSDRGGRADPAPGDAASDDAADAGISGQVTKGLAWSVVNNLSLRMSNVLVGVLLARLLVPEDFGVFAVALTVQAILMAVADLGLSSDLIRRGQEQLRGPTVATVALLTSGALATAMALAAGPIASALGSADAESAVRVLALTLVLSGVSVVPYAVLQRRFMQRHLFQAEAASLAVSTTVVLALVVGADQGALALAWSRVAAQVVTTVLLFRWSRAPLRLGFDRRIADEAIRFSAPLAVANLLSWALLNLDYVVISRVEGAVLLGFYVLAFNMSSWPMTALGQAIRNVALPAFSRQDQDPGALDASLRRSLGLAWAAGLFVSLMLGVLAGPVVLSVYGERWATSAGPLVALAALGSLRIVFDLIAAFLIARGASRTVLAVQVLWVAVLLPAMVYGTVTGGIVGAGWTHVAVAVAVVLPAYLVALARHRVAVGRLLVELLPAVAAALPAGAAAWAVSRSVPGSWVQLVLGGLAGLAVYAALVGVWARRRVRDLRAPAPEPAGAGQPGGAAAATVPGPSPAPDDTEELRPLPATGRWDPAATGPIQIVRVPEALPSFPGAVQPIRIPPELLRYRSSPDASRPAASPLRPVVDDASDTVLPLRRRQPLPGPGPLRAREQHADAAGGTGHPDAPSPAAAPVPRATPAGTAGSWFTRSEPADPLRGHGDAGDRRAGQPPDDQAHELVDDPADEHTHLAPRRQAR